MSGVSPAVVVPMMINIQESGLGVTKSIPALVIAASCIDNIVAITGHSLIIGIVFNSGQLWWIILQCPVQILIGICFGLVAAGFLSILLVDHSVWDFLWLLFLGYENQWKLFFLDQIEHVEISISTCDLIGCVTRIQSNRFY